MKNFRLVWSARSECGPNRKKNEDSIYPLTSGNNQPPFKAAVCDGLGGHVNGDVASKIAADTLNEELEDLNKVINYEKIEFPSRIRKFKFFKNKLIAGTDFNGIIIGKLELLNE